MGRKQISPILFLLPTMDIEDEINVEDMNIFKNIQKVVKNGHYALRPHAVSHMLAEGFDESNIVEAIKNGKILEHYIEEDRCLIVGTFSMITRGRESLHIVVDYWSESKTVDWVDIITAYIPRYPFWETPYKRGRK